jgi:hyperosmotically inducible protein
MKRKIVLGLVSAVCAVAPLTFVGCATNDSDPYDRTAGEYIDDKVLVQRVKGALGDNTVYTFPDVSVHTFKGTVQLSGFVASQEQKRAAEDITRKVDGVLSVQNNITLKGETQRVRGVDEREVDGSTTVNRERDDSVDKR